ncbi:hypothetical protein [Nannocystis punicea]|uniref:Uncharacterized protein n=1 Tax=Nannocystis punicea TaxID=2995304 RepID=A0ABY7GUG9_9BACT|nr:hypothetical protein [Nannocystis poenicansa]WAS90614.1 hypothetical protein O0S08_30880 [Nannocystis poenicansa]
MSIRTSMISAARAVALLLLAGCTGRPLDDPSSASGSSGVDSSGPGDGSAGSSVSITSAGSGAPPSTSGGTTSGAVTTGVPEPIPSTSEVTAAATGPVETDGGGQTFVVVPDAGGPTPNCDLWQNDCPAGQKCASASDDGVAWNHSRCVDIVPNPGDVGQPCQVFGSLMSGEDTCGAHRMCWDVDPVSLTGTCIAMCTGSERDPICPSESSCEIGFDGNLIPCVPGCDPLDPETCREGSVCVFLSPEPVQFVCAGDASEDAGHAFDPCEFANVCKPGLGCLEIELVPFCDPNFIGCCIPFCDVFAPNTCPGQGLECVPLFAPGEVPGKEHLGRCLPPP